MGSIKTIFIVLHVLGGFTALLTGVVPMIAQKGGLLHRRAGWVYTAAMTDVFITAVVLSTVLPLIYHTPINIFLLFVGVFSFYFVFSGLRGLRFFRPGLEHNATGMDKFAAILLLLFSVGLLYFAFFDPNTHKTYFNPIFLVFALFGINMARQDLMQFRQQFDLEKHRHHYFFHHMTRMLGSYIAAVTAFVVVNVHFLHPIVVWLGPGLIGGIGITYTVRYWRKKLDMA